MSSGPPPHQHRAPAGSGGRSVLADPETSRYCTAGCPHRQGPTEARLEFPTTAAAQVGGYLECVGCPAADGRAEPSGAGPSSVARAVRLVAAGEVERSGAAGVAVRLGRGAGELDADLRAELGVGLLALARAERVRTARVLLECTALPVAAVAAAAGFGSARQLGATLWSVTGASPQALRAAARPCGEAVGRHRSELIDGPGTVLDLPLPFRPPLLPDSLFGHLAATAVPGVEEWRDGAYRRTLRLPHGWAVVTLHPPAPGITSVPCRLRLSDLRDLRPAVAACRFLLDLDADPQTVDGDLSADPALAPLVAAGPGRRVPRTVDGHELALRAVLGQQVSTAAARTHAGRLVRTHGAPVPDPDGGLTHLFPDAATLRGLDPQALALPTARRRTVAALLDALTGGALDPHRGADPATVRGQLTALPGVGPWTAGTVLMRALGDDDVFLEHDLGIRSAADRLGLPRTPGALRGRAVQWSPWRSYAVQHLWATGEHAVNTLPG